MRLGLIWIPWERIISNDNFSVLRNMKFFARELSIK